MKSVIVASCKRVKGKVVRQIKKRQNRKKKTIRLADGAEVVVWGVGALEQEANKYKERFIRPQAEQYKTNIRQESSLAVKTSTPTSNFSLSIYESTLIPSIPGNIKSKITKSYV